MEWQDIKTAPLDGTEILGWRKDCGIIIIRYTSCDDFMTESEMEGLSADDCMALDWFCADFVRGDRLMGDMIPTHWMPLPPPPSQEK